MLSKTLLTKYRETARQTDKLTNKNAVKKKKKKKKRVFNIISMTLVSSGGTVSKYG